MLLYHNTGQMFHLFCSEALIEVTALLEPKKITYITFAPHKIFPKVFLVMSLLSVMTFTHA